MSNDEVSKLVEVEKELRINRVNPDNIRAVPANDILINHTSQDVFITFSLVEPPPILTEEEYQNIEKVDAITTTKIVISPEFLSKIINVLQINLDKYNERFKQDG